MQFDRLNSKAPLAISYLFVPGRSSRALFQSRRSGADAMILDLEDAVHPDSEPAARAAHLGLAGNNALRCLRALHSPATASVARCFART